MLGFSLSLVSGLVGLSRVGTADTYEAQLKLASQKWKARCKVSRHNQMWQDEDVSSERSAGCCEPDEAIARARH